MIPPMKRKSEAPLLQSSYRKWHHSQYIIIRKCQQENLHFKFDTIYITIASKYLVGEPISQHDSTDDETQDVSAGPATISVVQDI